MFELLRRWPQLEEVDVGTAVMAYGGPPRRKKNAPPNVNPDIIWDSVYDSDREYWMCKNRDEVYEDDPNPSYADAWIPAFPAIVPGAWPQLRKIAGDVLDDSVFAALPIMAPNLQQFTPSYTPLGPALNSALASWGHSLRRIDVRAGSSFDPGRRPDGVALGSTFAALHMLERAEVDSWILPAAHFAYLPPSLRELQYLSSRDNLAELVASRTLEQPNTASGLRKFVVHKLDSVALAMPDVESLTMVCAKRHIEVKIDKMYEDELMAMLNAEYEGRPLGYREFNWRKWRLRYLGDDCRDLDDEDEEDEDYDEDYDNEDEGEEDEDEGGDSGDER
ncbi:hypothetical protein EXIGLDRAFT_721501 [Exidia glandulosa HHB12029]|uniref:Uncharacterized protein n=1 Tax=Exidia glandulosa HHB12029 TaxID=1314781 RepID=A0A166A824_EXIGL|nr:hypothetical protein EXIGLDRAFT_721501 [Exidia glandulosa HHB12029]